MRVVLACLLCIAGWPAFASADYILGPAEVNKSLKAMERFLKQTAEAKSRVARADALAGLAKEANALTSLINLEIRSHGFEQKRLIDVAVHRCEELGIQIAYDSGKDRYVYDQSAYAEYLRVHPSGRHRQEAQFLVIERAFYTQKSTDRAGIATLTRDIERFLSRYPKDRRRAELEVYRVILYRDMSRLNANEPGGGVVEKERAKQLCLALIATYPGTSEAKVAEAILNGLK